MQFSRWQTWLTDAGVWCFVLFAASLTASAQFKTIGPAPFSPAVARERVRTLLAKVDSGNSRETTAKLSDLLAWYRDIIDDELIASWRQGPRENLIEVVDSLADSPVAVAVVNYSWREQRSAGFDLANAPLLGRLMARFPDSARPFLDDLLRRPPPDLAEPQAEAVCRILMDMPEIGTWRSSALQILPRYRQATENLLAQDARSSDKEKRFQALRWENDLNLDVPGTAAGPSIARRRPERAPNRDRTAVVLSPPPEADAAPAPIAKSSPPARVPVPPEATLSTPRPDPNSLPARPPVSVVSATQYEGPRSGTLESTGGAIPQNAEYVFRNLPPVKLQLDYNTKIWEARLAAGEGQTQRLIVRNKSSGPQKHCVVHWNVVQ